jgi:NAD(P)-dependent dehydrogenase (short-subunit alcohol dehydrogenase family)
MYSPGRFADKVCIVTGGGSGIGRAACLRFAAEGANVIIADLNDEHGRKCAGEIEAEHRGHALFVHCDVGKADDVAATVYAAASRWSRIDVLVNNAAMMTFQPVTELAPEKWDQVIRTDLTSVFLFCHGALPHMPRGSAIVNVSSVHAHETEAGVSPYVASKGGMEAFSRCLALECESRKVRVNCVAPGAVNTPMLWNNPNVKSGKEKVKGAVGEPEDIAAAICFLASAEARFIDGTTLVVDGARLDIL